MTQLSTRGAKFISQYEGWRDAPYNDPTNNATIGYGHLLHHGPVTDHDRAEWGTITQDHGLQLLQQDASVAESGIKQFITRELTQWEHDALTSFAFNCGAGALAHSVKDAINASQDPSAAIEQYIHSNGQVLDGLVRRRKAEAMLFTTGDYGDGQPAGAGGSNGQASAAADPTVVPTPVPDWAWHWVEWKLGRGQFKEHAGDPAMRAQTGAPEKIPPWGWTFLKRFQ